MTIYQVRHRSAFRYRRPIADGYTVARLVLRHTDTQRVISASVDVTPAPDERDEYDDAFGNRVLRLGVHRPHESLDVVSSCTVEVERAALPESSVPWERSGEAVASLRGGTALDVAPFVASSQFVDVDRHHDERTRLSATSFLPGVPLVEVVAALCHEISTTFEFDPAFTDVSTPLRQVLSARRGVCQDFAHMMIACLRLAGLAARSGAS